MRKKASFEGMVKIIEKTTLEELKQEEDDYYKKWQKARVKIQIKEMMLKYEKEEE